MRQASRTTYAATTQERHNERHATRRSSLLSLLLPSEPPSPPLRLARNQRWSADTATTTSCSSESLTSFGSSAAAEDAPLTFVALHSPRERQPSMPSTPYHKSIRRTIPSYDVDDLFSELKRLWAEATLTEADVTLLEDTLPACMDRALDCTITACARILRLLHSSPLRAPLSLSPSLPLSPPPPLSLSSCPHAPST